MSESGKIRIFSEEHKIKISKSNKGKIHSKETKTKISKGNKGKILSRECKTKISKAKMGKTFSEEHKINLSNSRKKRTFTYIKSYKLLSPDNEIFEGDNISKFAKAHNLDTSHISRVLRGLTIQLDKT